jgi:Sec-independent protein secretion pathway component TatC
MFYFKELYFRFLFITYAILHIYFYCYIHKNNIISIIIAPFFIFNEAFNTTFIQTDPAELFIVIINIVLMFTIFFFIPYILWVMLDFLKTGFYSYEYITIKQYLILNLLLVYIFNILALLYFFPLIWSFFNSFNSISFDVITVNQLLKIDTYIYFLYTFLKITNMFFIFLVLIYILIFLKGIIFLVKYKKLLTLLNILVATLLSPPEVYIQIVIFIVLQMTLEFFYLLFFYKLKINKEAY